MIKFIAFVLMVVAKIGSPLHIEQKCKEDNNQN